MLQCGLNITKLPFSIEILLLNPYLCLYLYRKSAKKRNSCFRYTQIFAVELSQT
jgi:hypothetical protein